MEGFMDQDLKIAVLIDADNISEKYIQIIMDETANIGIATYKRIYGDWTSQRLTSWKNVLLNHSIIPIQQYGYTTGKSSTDAAMIIDAMDILYSGNVDGFCIVSSDSDFTRLVARLRESGMLVVGMGESKTPKPFIAACNQFKYLDILYSNSLKETARSVKQDKQKIKQLKESLPAPASKEKTKVKEEPAPTPQTDRDTIASAILSIVEDGSDEEGWMFVGDVGNQLAKRYPDFDVRNFGFKRLSSFLADLEPFEIKRVRANGNRNIQLVYVRSKEA